MDIHVGQSYSFLVTVDQNATTDYYIVASPRFVNSSWAKATGVAILHYSNNQGPASGLLPSLPDQDDPSFSMNQARSIRWNVSAGAARPNPQGSFKYGDITVTDVFVILNRPPGYYSQRPPKVDTSLINATYNAFIEIIFQNNDTTVQTYHLDCYAFFVVGMDFGIWSENSNSRSTYNKWDGAWTAILVYIDNPGIWNMRAQNLNSYYLGQEVYVQIVDPEIKGTEASSPENAIYCGLLSSLQK
ncbi:hypothetical protein K1719_036363 [Acacia pycnantha]|nr:hypothetical protein K1719_036363 [Acacia pycnantha]